MPKFSVADSTLYPGSYDVVTRGGKPKIVHLTKGSAELEAHRLNFPPKKKRTEGLTFGVKAGAA